MHVDDTCVIKQHFPCTSLLIIQKCSVVRLFNATQPQSNCGVDRSVATLWKHNHICQPCQPQTVSTHCTWLALSPNAYSEHASVPPHVVAVSADAAEMRVPGGMECPGPGGGLLSCLQAASRHHPSQDLPSPRARHCRHQKFLSRIPQLRTLYLASTKKGGGGQRSYGTLFYGCKNAEAKTFGRPQ